MEENELSYLDDRSDEVQEILGKTPNWMIRWGTSSIFAIVIVLILGSALVEYNDVLSARIIITSKTPPAYIQANSNGKLNALFAQTGDHVSKGQPLAEIENPAIYEDVQQLREKLRDFSPRLTSLDSINVLFPTNLRLGNLNQAYYDFVVSYQKYVLNKTLNPRKKEIFSSEVQLRELRNLLSGQMQELQLFENELELSQQQYERNQQLYKKGVISKSEFETASRGYLTDKQQLENLKSSIQNTKVSIATLSGSKVQSTISDTELNYNYEQELKLSTESLKNAIRNWELSYLLVSPIDGELTMFDIRNKYQNVKVGEVVFTVVPQETDSLIGLVTLPIKNSGKVKKGQKLIVKLDNYPFQEWGSLGGEIVDISAVPKKGEASYSIAVRLDSLVTSYDKQLQFKQEMEGNAEIITEELSVLQRVFYQLNKALSR